MDSRHFFLCKPLLVMLSDVIDRALYHIIADILTLRLRPCDRLNHVSVGALQFMPGYRALDNAQQILTSEMLISGTVDLLERITDQIVILDKGFADLPDLEMSFRHIGKEICRSLLKLRNILPADGNHPSGSNTRA